MLLVLSILSKKCAPKFHANHHPISVFVESCTHPWNSKQKVMSNPLFLTLQLHKFTLFSSIWAYLLPFLNKLLIFFIFLNLALFYLNFAEKQTGKRATNFILRFFVLIMNYIEILVLRHSLSQMMIVLRHSFSQ